MQERGLRYYSATLSRWISRDPIGEKGGRGLYVFVHNAPHDRRDALGLCECDGPTTVSQADLELIWHARKKAWGVTRQVYSVGAKIGGCFFSTKTQIEVTEKKCKGTIRISQDSPHQAETEAHEMHHFHDLEEAFNKTTALWASLSGRCRCSGCTAALFHWGKLRAEYYALQLQLKGNTYDCSEGDADACSVVAGDQITLNWKQDEATAALADALKVCGELPW
jgi:hypothetical protein